MISHGDEFGRTQRGNNNAYCQDNELTWINWDLSPFEKELLSFVQKVFGRFLPSIQRGESGAIQRPCGPTK
jgi:hypothetical protein